MRRAYWGLVAVVAIAAGVFLADLFLADGVVLPTAPYAIAIVVAAHFFALDLKEQLALTLETGRVWVESEMGVGSTFSLSLPVAA